MSTSIDALPFDDCLITSAFQPIYSFTHRRLIGHEALIRARDAQGRAVSPPAVFARCADRAELRALDRSTRLLHLRNFARACEPSQWLFVNVDASAFDGDRDLLETVDPAVAEVERLGLRPYQIVLELLEAALPTSPAFEQWTDALKRKGFVLALDDFGAGHSNFDRVFRLRPHIVKLDRNVIVRANVDRAVRRVMTQMISLLHECGAQVLVEGVESAREADIALDADADFVQGFHFGRPAPTLRRSTDDSPEMDAVWSACDDRAFREAEAGAQRAEPYCRAVTEARTMLEAGRSMSEACASFLALEQADLCYLLDAHGVQVGRSTVFKSPSVHATLADQPFAPLLDVSRARFSRRGYFRSAIAAPEQIQVTRPYPTMHSPMLSVTFSVRVDVDGQTRVLCADKFWRPVDEHDDIVVLATNDETEVVVPDATQGIVEAVGTRP